MLVRQLAGGAPADILLTADPDWMNDATRQGLIQAETRIDLLANDLVLAGPAGAAAAGDLTSQFPLFERLAGGRLAMCDPDHDLAGRYAKQALQSLGLWESRAVRRLWLPRCLVEAAPHSPVRTWSSYPATAWCAAMVAISTI